MTQPAPHASDRKNAVTNRRILVVDDNPAIHSDFQKILSPKRTESSVVDDLEGILFSEVNRRVEAVTFELHSAHQGQDAFAMVKASLAEQRPYALAFVDVRMPPGWDGIETIARIWEIDPSLQVVICTAYSDYSWDDMRAKLGQPENLVVLKKPFDNVEVQQLAHALTRKWELNVQAEAATSQLAGVVRYMQDMLGQPSAASPGSADLAPWTAPAPTSPETALPLPPAHPVSGGEDCAVKLQLAEVLERIKETLENSLRQLRDTEVQLVQAEKMASLGRMAASIFHEINNPLNYTLMAVNQSGRHAQALPADRQSEFKESLTDIREGLLGISRIVQDLREFTHPRYGTLDAVDVSVSLDTALRLLAAEIRDRVHVENLVPRGFTVHAVRNRLTQVFLNLIQNSVDALHTKTFAPGTRPEIRFEATELGETRTIRIRDNGPGIPAANLGKVFEPFFTSKSVGRGTGLGLSICYRLLRDVGASISVASEEHAYCEFTLAFPLNPEMPKDSPVHPDAISPSTTPGPVVCPDVPLPAASLVAQT